MVKRYHEQCGRIVKLTLPTLFEGGMTFADPCRVSSTLRRFSVTEILTEKLLRLFSASTAFFSLNVLSFFFQRLQNRWPWMQSKESYVPPAWQASLNTANAINDAKKVPLTSKPSIIYDDTVKCTRTEQLERDSWGRTKQTRGDGQSSAQGHTVSFALQSDKKVAQVFQTEHEAGVAADVLDATFASQLAASAVCEVNDPHIHQAAARRGQPVAWWARRALGLRWLVTVCWWKDLVLIRARGRVVAAVRGSDVIIDVKRSADLMAVTRHRASTIGGLFHCSMPRSSFTFAIKCWRHIVAFNARQVFIIRFEITSNVFGQVFVAVVRNRTHSLRRAAVAFVHNDERRAVQTIGVQTGHDRGQPVQQHHDAWNDLGSNTFPVVKEQGQGGIEAVRRQAAAEELVATDVSVVPENLQSDQ